MEKKVGEAFTPHYLHKSVDEFVPSDPVKNGRGKARQEDAQEFLIFILNALHEELVKLLRKEPQKEDAATSASAEEGGGEAEGAGGGGGKGSSKSSEEVESTAGKKKNDGEGDAGLVDAGSGNGALIVP
jgi:hypothetical protein